MIEYVYYLVCPVEKTVKYVGKSKDPKKRYKQHISILDAQLTPKRKWLEGLFNLKKLPILQVVEKVEGDARDREQYHFEKNKSTILNIHHPEKGKSSRKWK